MELGGNGWIVAVNLIIWTGLFVYLLRLGKKLGPLEKNNPGREP
jgi:CcmD family protein